MYSESRENLKVSFLRTWKHAKSSCWIKVIHFCWVLHFLLSWMSNSTTKYTGDALLTTSLRCATFFPKLFRSFSPCFNLKIQNSFFFAIEHSMNKWLLGRKGKRREYRKGMNFITINIWTVELDENFWIAMRKVILIRENWNIFKWAILSSILNFQLSKQGKTFYEPMICQWRRAREICCVGP